MSFFRAFLVIIQGCIHFGAWRVFGQVERNPQWNPDVLGRYICGDEGFFPNGTSRGIINVDQPFADQADLDDANPLKEKCFTLSGTAWKFCPNGDDAEPSCIPKEELERRSETCCKFIRVGPVNPEGGREARITNSRGDGFYRFEGVDSATGFAEYKQDGNDKNWIWHEDVCPDTQTCIRKGTNPVIKKCRKESGEETNTLCRSVWLIGEKTRGSTNSLYANDGGRRIFYRNDVSALTTENFDYLHENATGAVLSAVAWNETFFPCPDDLYRNFSYLTVGAFGDPSSDDMTRLQFASQWQYREEDSTVYSSSHGKEVVCDQVLGSGSSAELSFQELSNIREEIDNNMASYVEQARTCCADVILQGRVRHYSPKFLNNFDQLKLQIRDRQTVPFFAFHRKFAKRKMKFKSRGFPRNEGRNEKNSAQFRRINVTIFPHE